MVRRKMLMALLKRSAFGGSGKQPLPFIHPDMFAGEVKKQADDKKLFMRSDYNDHSYPQMKMFSPAVKYIDLAFENLELDASTASNCLMIADYGSSTGANSSIGVKIVLDRIWQKYGSDQRVMVVHNDLPDNNWSQLFNYLNNNEGSYLYDTSNSAHVNAVSSGKSFYEQVLPNQSLHFGFSSVAIHWLSKLPCKLQNHLMPNLGTPKEIEIFRQQAAEDWERFLVARSKEVVKGGILVINVPSTVGWGYLPILEAYYSALSRVYQMGIITQDELLDFNLPIFYRSLDDVTDTEQLKRHGFELIIGEDSTNDPSYFYEALVSCEDKLEWASEVSNGILAVDEPLFYQTLSSHRSEEEKKAICAKIVPFFINEAAKIQPSQLSDPRGNVFVVLKRVE